MFIYDPFHIARLITAVATSTLAISGALRGETIYRVDPATGDDANLAGKPWKTFGKLNAMKLAPGDKVIISPGFQEETLKPSGAGTAEKPVVIQFLPGIHTIGIRNVMRLPIFVSNSQDTTEPKPVGILIQNFKHLHLEGGGVEADGKTTILYDGRMVQIWNDHSEGITFKGLVFDLKRPTVSEFRVLEADLTNAVIQVAEGSDYAVENGKFRWLGDWGPGAFSQTFSLDDGRCWRSHTPRGWDSQGQMDASAKDLGGRKVRLEYPNRESELKPRHQYHFRNTTRDSVGVHNSRSKDIAFRDCDFHALTGMGFVSQFTENIIYQRVNVAPPRDSIRTCAAWGDIFHFSNCRGDILVDSCRLSGMQDDAVNCHGTFLRIMEKPSDNQLLMRFMHEQTYGFAAFTPGDEVAVICSSNLREYADNPRRKVTAVERKSDRDWLLTLDGPVPSFEQNDVVDNITWQPNITVRNNDVSVDPVRGFLLSTRGRTIIENNTFHRCAMDAILISGDTARWFESSPVRDLLIRGNTFIGCGISIEPHTQSSKPEEPVHENIRIIDNDFDAAEVFATNVKGLTVTGNRSPKGAFPIKLTPSCTEVKVENNEARKEAK
jgi:Right handed beta helix region